MDLDIVKLIKESENAESPADKLLKKGIPIYYYDKNIADGIIKEYPDGRKEVVVRDEKDQEIVLREL